MLRALLAVWSPEMDFVVGSMEMGRRVKVSGDSMVCMFVQVWRSAGEPCDVCANVRSCSRGSESRGCESWPRLEQ